MPRTEKQNEKIRNKRRQKILNESLYLFAKKPFKAVSIDDIANEVGCTHSLIYHYFSSKEVVYKAVLELAKNNLHNLLNPSMEFTLDSPLATLERILDGIFEGLKGSKREEVACSIILILDVIFNEDNLADEIMPREKRPFYMINKVIEEGQKKGEFLEGDTREYTVILLGLLRGLSIASLSLRKDLFIVPKTEIIMRMLVKEGN